MHGSPEEEASDVSWEMAHESQGLKGHQEPQVSRGVPTRGPRPGPSVCRGSAGAGRGGMVLRNRISSGASHLCRTVGRRRRETWAGQGPP